MPSFLEKLKKGMDINETKAADKLEKAVAKVIKKGKDVTYDLKPNRDDPSAVGTKEMADSIAEYADLDKEEVNWLRK